MALLTPDYSDLPWGRNEFEKFDVLLSPKRTGRNAVFVFKHGGGGVSGNKVNSWTSANSSYFMMKYLIDHAYELERPVDCVSIESSAVAFDSRKRTISESKIRQAKSLQRGVAALKRHSRRFGWDPSAFVLAGTSDGASQASLAQLLPPIKANGELSSYQPNSSDSGEGYDSQVACVVNHVGQIDVRTIDSVNQLDVTCLKGWTQTATTSAGEFAALSDGIKEAMSLLAYIENGDVAFWKPLFALWFTTGDHQKPYIDPHDSQQYFDLMAAMRSARLPHDGRLYTSGQYEHISGGATSETTDSISKSVSDFIQGVIG